MIGYLVKKRPAVYMFAVLIIIVGIWAYITLPREAMPQIEQPYIFISTQYFGVAARDIEQLVTRPLEEEIEGIDGVDQITSTSRQSFSFVAVEFTSGTSVDEALRKVREKVDAARSGLPADAEEPTVTELSSSIWPILVAVLSHPRGLKLINDDARRLRDELEAIPGVLEVNIAGNLTREVAIELDPGQLERYGLSVDDVRMALESENTSIPGGFLETPLKKYSLSVNGEIKSQYEFNDIVVSVRDVSIPFSALGTAQFTWAEPQSYSRMNGEPAISLSITKRAGENIIAIVDNVKKRIDAFEETLPPYTTITYAQDQSVRVRNLVRDLENNILTGLLLVLIVTLFFLGRVNALFVSLAIPFSMLFSFAMLQFFGITLNMVVLFSLVMALGMLVDNGIVIVENIYRHASEGMSRVQASIEGAKQVAAPITASTITTLLAFTPVLFMPDIMGDFMSFVPKTIIIVLSGSLLTAITILPVLCAHFLRISEKNKRKMSGGSWFTRLLRWYEKHAAHAINHPYRTILLVVAAALLGAAAYALFGKDVTFFSEVDPPDAVVSIEAPSGTPLDQTDTLVRKVEDIISRVPASLDNYQSTTGRGNEQFAAGPENNQGIVRLSFAPFVERKVKAAHTIDAMRALTDSIPGATITVEGQELGPPAGSPVSYRITGKEYATLGIIAQDVLGIIEQYPAFRLVNSDFEPAQPEIRVHIQRQKAALFGLTTRAIATTIRTAINGIRAGTYRQQDDEYDIVIRYAERYRNAVSALPGLSIVNRHDERVPLASVARIDEQSALDVIKRRNLQRAVEVWADFQEDAKQRNRIEQRIASQIQRLSIPDGYAIAEGESAEMQTESTQFLQRAFIVALLLIGIVLVALFNSYMQPFIILVSVGLSLGGVLLGYTLIGQPFVIIMSGVGVIALAGVVVNNGIVLIDYVHILIDNGEIWPKAILEAGKTRLRPVLLTAITTILGIMPMALGISIDFRNFAIQIGSESTQLWKPFAWAMIFGLTFATITTLIFVPAMLAINYRFAPPKKMEE